jgi:ariadne-1
MAFDGAFAEKHERKTYEVEFSVQSVKHLVASQDKEIEQVTTILGK